jgi:hypothetical protein
MTKKTTGKSNGGRDSGGFVALPWAVLDCPAYKALSHPARALLMEVARQYVRDNNGRLLLSGAYLAVASRTIIWSLIEQVRVSLVPLFHRLHRRLALEH